MFASDSILISARVTWSTFFLFARSLLVLLTHREWLIQSRELDYLFILFSFFFCFCFVVRALCTIMDFLICHLMNNAYLVKNCNEMCCKIMSRLEKKQIDGIYWSFCAFPSEHENLYKCFQSMRFQLHTARVAYSLFFTAHKVCDIRRYFFSRMYTLQILYQKKRIDKSFHVLLRINL